MSQFDLGPQGRKDYDNYFSYLFKFFNNLKNENKLNPNLKNIIQETDKRIWYFDQVRKATDKLDWIIFDQQGKRFDSFLEQNKTHGITTTHIMQIYGSLILFNFLIFYSNIEILFLTMLKNTKIENSNDFIKGNETLGKLLPKLFKLDSKKVLPQDSMKKILDVKFRNALAHGWFRIENHQLLYFEESIDTKAKILYENDWLKKLIDIKIFGLALSHLVLGSNW